MKSLGNRSFSMVSSMKILAKGVAVTATYEGAFAEFAEIPQQLIDARRESSDFDELTDA